MTKIILALLAYSVGASPVIAQTKTVTANQSIERGKLVYQQLCLTCHQGNGGGVPNMNPPLIKSPWVSGDKKKLINIVLIGFSEKVAINGACYSNNMPSQATLTDQQIADVLSYVRVNFGNIASAIMPKDVLEQRKMIK